jgi:hypothetical protein
MGKVISEISMSLDGFVTGPNVRVGNGMGDEGDRLHDWKFDAKTATDDAIVECGATPRSRRTSTSRSCCSGSSERSHQQRFGAGSPAAGVVKMSNVRGRGVRPSRQPSGWGNSMATSGEVRWQLTLRQELGPSRLGRPRSRQAGTPQRSHPDTGSEPKTWTSSTRT